MSTKMKRTIRLSDKEIRQAILNYIDNEELLDTPANPEDIVFLGSSQGALECDVTEEVELL